VTLPPLDDPEVMDRPPSELQIELDRLREENARLKKRFTVVWRFLEIEGLAEWFQTYIATGEESYRRRRKRYGWAVNRKG
jgi:hypothetical protein